MDGEGVGCGDVGEVADQSMEGFRTLVDWCFYFFRNIREDAVSIAEHQGENTEDLHAADLLPVSVRKNPVTEQFQQSEIFSLEQE